MAQYDGSIRINTAIETKGFKDGEKEIESESRRMAESISKTAKQIKKEIENLENAQKYFLEAGGSKKSSIYQEYEKDIKRLQESLKSLNDTKSDVEPSDEHLNQLKVDVEEYAKSLKELQDQGKFFGDEEYDKVYLAWKNATDAVKAYQAELNKKTESGQAKIAEQEARAAEKREAAQRRAEEQAEKALQKENERIQKQIENEAKLAAKEAERQAKIQAEAAEEERLAQIKANATVSDQQIIDLLERRKQLIAEIKDMESAGAGLGYKQYEDANRELEEVNGKIKDYRKNLDSVPEKFEKMRASAKKAFNAVASGTKKSSGLLSTFASRLKGLALSLLIFNWISKGFNAMISGMKAGFNNFTGYSDSFANSVQSIKNAMATLGNQFAAAFAPIVQMVVPWLNSLINALTTAMTHVSQFFAILGGKSTFTRSVQIQDKYNKALGGTAAAAKKAFGALAKFDDLDVLQKQDDASSGAGGMEQTLPENMFEEVPVDKNIISWLDSILTRLKELKNIFAQGFWDGLGDWEYRWESIKSSISSIKDSLINIWTDPAVLGSADGWFNSVVNMLGVLVGSTASIGLTIATNIIGGIEKYLEQNTDRIKGHLVSMFDIWEKVNNLFSELFKSIAYVFEAFASEEGQQLTANIIGIFVDAFMGITEFASKLFLDISQCVIKPFSENKETFRTVLEGFLGVLSEVTGTIKQGIDDTFDKLNDVYDEHFKPFFNSVTQGLSELTGRFLEFIGWIIENIIPVILPVIEGIIEGFFIFNESVLEVVGGIIDAIGGITDFLVGVFTGDWKKAWDGIVKIFDGVKTSIKAIVNGMISIVEAFANGVVDAMNAVIRAINSIHVDIPDWVPGFGGKSIGFNLSEISRISIPRLATGAVIRGGNPFMAILGDQPSGITNIETPLPTMIEAFKQAITDMGGISGRERVPVNINLNYDGETFARLSISDILSELGREGYNVDVLGVT